MRSKRQKKESKPHQCGRTEQPTAKGISSSLNTPQTGIYLFKQTSEATILFSAVCSENDSSVLESDFSWRWGCSKLHGEEFEEQGEWKQGSSGGLLSALC